MHSFNKYYYLKEDNNFDINLGIYFDRIQRSLIDNVYTGDIDFKQYPSLTELPRWFKDIEIRGTLHLIDNRGLKSFKNIPNKCTKIIGPAATNSIHDINIGENCITSLKGLEDIEYVGSLIIYCKNLLSLKYLPLNAGVIKLHNLFTLEGIRTNSDMLHLLHLNNISSLTPLREAKCKTILIYTAPEVKTLEGLSNSTIHLSLQDVGIESFKGIPSSTKQIYLEDCNNIKSFYDLRKLYLESFEIQYCYDIPDEQWQYCPVVDRLVYASDEKISRELRLKLDLLRASGRIKDLIINAKIEEIEDDNDPFNL